MSGCYGNILQNSRLTVGDRKQGEKPKTQAQVAEILGLSEQTIQGWETGKYKVNEEKLLLLAEIYHDETLPIRYLEQTSPVWKKVGKIAGAVLALQQINQQMAAIMPHVAVLIDTANQVSQLAC